MSTKSVGEPLKSVERLIQVQNLADFQPVRESAGLQLDADDRMERVSVGLRVEAEHGERAPVRASQAGQAFDGGGFAGSVRTEHPEYFACVHRE